MSSKTKKQVKRQGGTKTQSVSSSARLEELLEETQKELDILAPRIDKLEKQMDTLRDLKKQKQKLITLKLSIQSILNNYSDSAKDFSATDIVVTALHENAQKLSVKSLGIASQKRDVHHSTSVSPTSQLGAFIPERAFHEVSSFLRRKNSVNYELFRAIVLNGGVASSDEIRHYLVEHRVKQPATGQTFENVELTDISSRVNYLVRKGVVDPDGKGRFISRLGWLKETDAN